MQVPVLAHRSQSSEAGWLDREVSGLGYEPGLRELLICTTALRQRQAVSGSPG